MLREAEKPSATAHSLTRCALRLWGIRTRYSNRSEPRVSRRLNQAKSRRRWGIRCVKEGPGAQRRGRALPNNKRPIAPGLQFRAAKADSVRLLDLFLLEEPMRGLIGPRSDPCMRRMLAELPSESPMPLRKEAQRVGPTSLTVTVERCG